MKLRGIIALALALACAPVMAQVNPGTSPLSLKKGGTGSDLSVTGGASQFLRQNSVGAPVAPIRPACADLSNGAASCSTDATNASNISSGLLGLARGGLGGSQSAATANQIPVFPGSAGAAAPTTVGGSGGLFDAICSSTVGQTWVRLTGGWGCLSLGYANPVWWGADPAGSIDSTSAINSAAASSLYVFFPPGTYKISSAITPPLSSRFIGSGYQGTTLKTTSAACNILAISNGFVTVEDIAFASSSTCSSGAFIALSAGNFTGKNLYATGAFNCLTIGTASSSVNVAVVLIDQLQCINTVASTGVSIVVNNTGGGNIEMRNIFMNNSSGARPFAHINLINSPDFTCVDCNILSASNDLYVNPGNGQSVVSTNFIGGFLDQASSSAANFLPTGTGFIGRSRFLGTWFYCANSSCSGFTVTTAGTSTVDGLECAFCDIFGNSVVSTNGVAFTQGAGTAIKNVSINGGRIAGWANGITINGLTSGSIRTAKIGASSFPANTVGVSLSGTIGTLSITTNDLTGNTTSLTNSSTPTLLTISDNPGYNPVGLTAGTSTGTSASTISAGPSPETHYITQSATFNAAVKSGATTLCTVATATIPCVIQLGPNESYSVTWATTQPTYSKYIH